jgi:hypothetical protein
MSSIDSDCFDFQIHIWLYVYVTDDPDVLKQQLDSVLGQKYDHLTVLLSKNDCDNNSANIIDEFAHRFKRKIVFIENANSVGYYQNMKKAIEHMREAARANDIFMEVGPSCTYHTNYSLKHIILNILMNKTWLLYGNYINADYGPVLDGEPYNISNYYVCFSVFLLKNLTDEDLRDRSSTFLKLLSLCGEERVWFCDLPIVNKITNIPDETSLAKLVEGDILPNIVHLVLFVEHRHHNLLAIVKSINANSCDGQIVLHIVNVNPGKWDQVLILQKFSFPNIKIRLCNTNISQKSYSRLIYLRKILQNEPSSFAILLDDEMLIPPNWVQEVINFRSPLIYGCSNGMIFDKRMSVSKISFYNNSNSRTVSKEYFDYGATEGSIIDMNLILSSFLFKLDKKYILCFDELWLSFFVSGLLGLSIKNLNRALFNKVSEDVNDFRSNIDFVESSKLLLNGLLEAGFIRTNHLNRHMLNDLLLDDGYYDKCAKQYKTVEFVTFDTPPLDSCNVVLQFYYDNNNDLINNISCHTIKNYCLKINCNLIRIDMTGASKDVVDAKLLEIKKVFQTYEKILLIDGAVYINTHCPNMFNIIDNNKINCVFRGNRADLSVVKLSASYSNIYKGDETAFNRLSEEFNFIIDVNNSSSSYKQTLLSKNIINLNGLTNIHNDIIRIYKMTIDPKVTLVIMNCHRPFALLNTIIPFYDLYCNDIIDQAIIYHAKEETMFNYTFISKNIFAQTIYNSEDEKRYVLFNRYIQPGKYAFNECILIVDDDVIPSRKLLLDTYDSWKKNKMNIHGSKGRTCEEPPLFTYSFRDNNCDRASIILTSFLMVSLQIIMLAIKEEPIFYELTKHYRPIWNGEDIFLSLLAVNLTNQKNFVIAEEGEMIIFKRDSHAISSGDQHVRYRTQLVSILCEYYKIDKYKFLL